MSFLRVSAVVLGAALAAGACTGGSTPAPTSTASPAASAAAPATPAAPTPVATPPAPTPVESATPAPAVTSVVIRASTTQALAPQYLFTNMPMLVVTADGRALTQGAVPRVFPGPLLPAVLERQITPAGVQKLVAAARAAGLLSPDADFTGGAMVAGGMLGQLTIVADGTTYHLTGPVDGNPPCTAAQATCAVPEKATAAAYLWFWNGLADLSSWLGSDLSQASAPYVPTSYAILVGPPPNDVQPGNVIATWPLKDQPLAGFGQPYVMGGFRCGTVTGDAAAQLRPALEQANQQTAWVDDPTQSATRSILVRPIVPGDGDYCTGAE
jgi:hypothetical protein